MKIKVKPQHLAHLTMFAGVLSLLSIVTVTSHSVAAGEMAYQELWLGRMAIVFVIGATISLCIYRKEDTFYPSVVWALIVLGGIEAIWGLRQIYGLSSSNHSLYAVTGSFYNPGPYSGYLAMVFPICLSEWLLLKNKANRNWVEHGKYYTTIGVLVMLVCVLPAGMSRSAWIAAALSGLWVYGMHHSWEKKMKKAIRKHWKRALGIAVGGSLILIIAGYALFQLKANSANGRLLMWKVSCMTIAEKPLMGHGIGNFAAAYGEAQERYFTENNYSEKEELVAGSPEYAFNEYLQIAIEYGSLLLVCILPIIAICLWAGYWCKSFSACGGVIATLIFAFSSYPMQIPIFALTFFFLLTACLTDTTRQVTMCAILFTGLAAQHYIKNNKYEACKDWHSARMQYNIKAYSSAKQEYERLYPQLNDRGAFLFEYGHCLHNLKEYAASTHILKEAEKYSCDPMILNIIGKNYQAEGGYTQAEEYLIRSTHRLPGRIYPYYLLAKLYTEPKFNQPKKFEHVAKVVLTKEPKVLSTAIREMREEVKKLQTLNP